MGAILAEDNFKCIFLNEYDRIPIQISLRFAFRSSIDNKPALVQVMAWRRIGDKPLSEPMLTQFTDIYAALGGDESINHIAVSMVNYGISNTIVMEIP